MMHGCVGSSLWSLSPTPDPALPAESCSDDAGFCRSIPRCRVFPTLPTSSPVCSLPAMNVALGELLNRNILWSSNSPFQTLCLQLLLQKHRLNSSPCFIILKSLLLPQLNPNQQLLPPELAPENRHSCNSGNLRNYCSDKAGLKGISDPVPIGKEDIGWPWHATARQLFKHRWLSHNQIIIVHKVSSEQAIATR